MKKILFILLIITAVLPMSARTVNYPSMLLNTTDRRSDISLTVCGVDILPDSTVVRMSVKFRPNYWITISKNTFIKAQGNSYPLLRANGIKIGEQFWMPETGSTEFDLVFPAIPADTKALDLIESNDWQFLGIDVSDGKDREQQFAKFCQDTFRYDYTYLSPLMLKTLSGKSVQNIPTDKVTRLEMVTSKFYFRDDRLEKAVLDVITSNGMELISKENRKDKVSEFYAVWDEASQRFPKLLIVQPGTEKQYAKALYLEGNFGISDIQTIIKTPDL